MSYYKLVHDAEKRLHTLGCRGYVAVSENEVRWVSNPYRENNAALIEAVLKDVAGKRRISISDSFQEPTAIMESNANLKTVLFVGPHCAGKSRVRTTMFRVASGMQVEEVSANRLHTVYNRIADMHGEGRDVYVVEVQATPKSLLSRNRGRLLENRTFVEVHAINESVRVMESLRDSWKRLVPPSHYITVVNKNNLRGNEAHKFNQSVAGIGRVIESSPILNSRGRRLAEADKLLRESVDSRAGKMVHGLSHNNGNRWKTGRAAIVECEPQCMEGLTLPKSMTMWRESRDKESSDTTATVELRCPLVVLFKSHLDEAWHDSLSRHFQSSFGSVSVKLKLLGFDSVVAVTESDEAKVIIKLYDDSSLYA